jgi:hypothetical protein
MRRSLELPILGDILDDEVDSGECSDLRCRPQSRQNCGGVDTILLQKSGEPEILGNPTPRRLELFLPNVDEDDVMPGLRKQLRNSRTDDPGPHHTDMLKSHRA